MSEAKSILPRQTKDEFIADAKRLFSLGEDKIDIIVNELQNKGHSFSHSYTSRLLQRRVRIVNKLVAIILYTVHMKLAHGFTLDDFEKGFISLGCDSARVRSFITKLKTFTDETNQQLDALYWIALDTKENPRIIKIDGSLSYTRLESEDRKSYGLTPIVNLRIELQNIEQRNRVTNLQQPLEDFEQIIENLNELYSRFLEDIKTLKLESGSKLVGIPQRDK